MKESPIGNWKFSKQAISTFKKLNKKSAKTGLEYGTKLCGTLKAKPPSIETSGECIGNECEITHEQFTKTKCSHKETIGEFHTHPDMKVFLPSSSDLLRMEELGNNTTCIGTPSADNKKDLIKCIILKDDESYKGHKDIRIKTLLLIENNILNGKYILDEVGRYYNIYNPEDYVE